MVLYVSILLQIGVQRLTIKSSKEFLIFDNKSKEKKKNRKIQKKRYISFEICRGKAKRKIKKGQKKFKKRYVSLERCWVVFVRLTTVFGPPAALACHWKKVAPLS
jgi:hypothetical protein